ncbi:DUF4848 domain-containing protein [Parabacteroides johnsonii]|uniref:DUF4848 domain-containing protein n=2 Tax=Parabacteroides johnsonii TaxID=387661 RepID=UPI00242AA486|nr:DUF4848 domain-containing protein [Parabacteroides johnsonii]
MKKLLFSAAVCSLFMISCNNEMESDLSNVDSKIVTKAFVNDVDFQIVNYNGEDCFQFRNDSTYNKTITKLAEMSNEEVDAFFSGFNFISQQKLMEEADKEQEVIVDAYEKDPSQPWPYQQIAEFKQKYADVFMFNPYDSTDFVANYKVQNPLYRNLANKQGLFLIGDSIIKCPLYTLEELFGSPIAVCGDNIVTTEENSTNEAESKYQIPGGDYVKVRARWHFLPISIYIYNEIDYLSQKKKVLWKKHHATIILTYEIKSSSSPFEAYYYNAGFKIQIGGRLDTEVYDKRNGMRVGRFTELAKPSASVAVGPFTRFLFDGKMSIWSNEIPEKNKGVSKLSYHQNW